MGSRRVAAPKPGTKIAGAKFIEDLGKNKNGRRIWRFECTCGEIFDRQMVQQRHWHKKGKQRLCGQSANHFAINIGDTFGRWTVVGFGRRPAYEKKRDLHYTQHAALCRCSCGKSEDKLVLPYLLVNGESKSCGCYRLQRISEVKTTHGLSDTQQQYMFANAKGRAKREKLPFGLSIEDCVIPDICPLLGIKIKQMPRGEKITGRQRADDSPSLDRIDPAKGYVKGNVWVVSWRANDLKKDATVEELELLTKNLRARTNKGENCSLPKAA